MLNNNYRKEMVSQHPEKIAEELADLAGLQNSMAADESIRMPEAAQTKKAPGRSRKAKIKWLSSSHCALCLFSAVHIAA